MSETKTYKGIKALRAQSAKKPEYSCNNCKCVRYSPCTCMKKGDK